MVTPEQIKHKIAILDKCVALIGKIDGACKFDKSILYAEPTGDPGLAVSRNGPEFLHYFCYLRDFRWEETAWTDPENKHYLSQENIVSSLEYWAEKYGELMKKRVENYTELLESDIFASLFEDVEG